MVSVSQGAGHPFARTREVVHNPSDFRGVLPQTTPHENAAANMKAVLEKGKKEPMPNTPPNVSPSALQAIGNTPIVTLRKLISAQSARVFVKLEYFNPTGSYKDRMALAMIEEAEARGDLRPGMTVVEYTGGSTGSSLAFVCAVKGYRFKVVSSDAFAREKLQTMRAFGAELTIVPSQGGQITPDLVPRMIEEARKLAQAEDTYWTNQFHNADTLKGYEHIGQELLEQVDGPIHAFCGAVGTAGMLMGVARALHGAN